MHTLWVYRLLQPGYFKFADNGKLLQMRIYPAINSDKAISFVLELMQPGKHLQCEYLRKYNKRARSNINKTAQSGDAMEGQ